MAVSNKPGDNRTVAFPLVRAAREAAPREAVVVPFRPRRGPSSAAGAVHVRWFLIEPRARFATAFVANTGACLHLVAERLPNCTAWDWQVWQARSAGPSSRTGTAPSALAAATAAEVAARDWRENGLGRMGSDAI